MTIEELEMFVHSAGRYQVFSDGCGNYAVIPIMESAVLNTTESHEQLSAPPNDLIYNNQTG
ncbi:hypothetical protein [Buttiauxella sp. 3AFRM03]|uniref:hypothetical protein n=1 Tax=Buttiauxella sp. 3AFRM03 TaxID=2479367 RepID=UPI00138FE9ED|nr:hypothetical protein [Buttiauxella sp. 3AFRM03]